MRVLGFMSGTSLDAVDMAVLETDGETLEAFGPAGERKLSETTRAAVQAAVAAAFAWPRGAPEPPAFAAAARAVAEEHIGAATDFLRAHGFRAADLDLVGFHGQTVLHERPAAGRPGRTAQVGDAALIAAALGVPVVYDLRQADVAAGGEGAPLAPVYHAARLAASGLAAPAAVLNLGGVGNVTLVRPGGELLAFDTGPANGMIDLLVQERTDARFDDGGRLARAGAVDEDVLAAYLAHPYFAAPPPKSLDRYDFSLDPVRGLSLADAAATLTAFAAEAAAQGLRAGGSGLERAIVSGGGRSNPALVEAIARRSGLDLVDADAVGWRGDAIEAEAFAFLAARSVRGLPISFPGTTGVPRPMTGGRLARP